MKIRLAETSEELEGILQLQAENHVDIIPDGRKTPDGFVTVRHNLDLLTKMNHLARQVIAIDDDQVVAYALVMVKEMRQYIPVLQPMFTMFEQLTYNNRLIADYNFYVIGQICVKDGYRGKGLFQQLYDKHKESYSSQYDFCITEVSTSNQRSMRAHEKKGFTQIHRFTDPTDEWNILLWDWQ